jgi:hypothetical protein
MGLPNTNTMPAPKPVNPIYTPPKPAPTVRTGGKADNMPPPQNTGKGQQMPSPPPPPSRPMPAPILASDPASQLRYYSGWTQKAIPVYAPRPAAATPQAAIASKGQAMPAPVPISYNYEIYNPSGRLMTGKAAEDYLNFAKSDLYNQYKDYQLSTPLNADYGDAYYSGYSSKQIPIYAPRPAATTPQAALAAKSQPMPALIGQETKYYDKAGNELTGAALQDYLSYVDRDKAGTDLYLPSAIDVATSNNRYFLPHTNASGNYAVLPDVMYQGKKLQDAEKQYQYLLAMGHPAALQEKSRRDLFAREQQLQTQRDVDFLSAVRANTARAAYLNQNFTEIPVADPNHGKEWQQAVQTFLDNTNIGYLGGYDYYGRTADQRPAEDPSTSGLAAKAAMFPDNPAFAGVNNRSSLLTGQKSQLGGIPDRIWNNLAPAERQAIQAIDAKRKELTAVLQNPFSAFTYGVTDQDVYGDPSKKPVRHQTRGPGGILFGGNPGAGSIGWRNDNPVPPDSPGAGLWVIGLDPNDPRSLSTAYQLAMQNINDRPKKGGEGGRRFDKYKGLVRQNPDGTWNKITDPQIAQNLLNDVDAYYRELAFRMDMPKRTFSIGSLFSAFIPALVGIATGNPYLAGLAGFGQAASKGDVLGMVTNVLGMGVNAYGGFGKVLSKVGVRPSDVIAKAGTVTSIPKLNTWISSAVKDFLDPTKVGQYTMSLGGFATTLSRDVISQMSDMEKAKLIKEPFYGQLYGKLTPQERSGLNLPPPDYSGQLNEYKTQMGKLTEFSKGAGKKYSENWATQARDYITGTQPQTAARGGLMQLRPRYAPMRHRAFA